MTRFWWLDDDARWNVEPPAEAPATAAPAPPDHAQLVEYRASLRRKLMLMRPRSVERAGTERRLVKVTAWLLRLEAASRSRG